jgi:hypothetical protein
LAALAELGSRKSTEALQKPRVIVSLVSKHRLRPRFNPFWSWYQILVTDALADYALEHGAQTASPWRIAAAIKALAAFWGRTVAEVTRETCRAYERARARSAGTVRRELGVLRASINHGPASPVRAASKAIYRAMSC